MPDTPDGSEVVAIVSVATTGKVKLAWAVFCGVLLSATRTVKFEVPDAEGVPAMLAPDSVNPAGRLPEAIDQVYGAVPPLADRVWE